MRKIISKYPFRCNSCRKRFLAGTVCYWAKGMKPICPDCYSPGKAEDTAGADTGGAAGGNSSKDETGRGHFHIEWSELRDIVCDAIGREGKRHKYPNFRNSQNRATYEGLYAKERPDFYGYSLTQARLWAEEGYETDALKGLSDFAPPLREKRRFVYGEEGDEIDLSAAWAGEDNFMTHWSKRQVIPGVSLDFNMTFYAGVNASVVNDFIHWIAQSVFAIESAGIDPEINVTFPTGWRWAKGYRGGDTRIRVKKEMETVDAAFWSAMLSPAAFRTFGFAAIVLAADSIGAYADSGVDTPDTSETSWKVKYDPDSATIRVNAPWRANDFPAESMTAQLRQAIEELKGNFNT
jgi:hypothetical protein